MSGRWSSSDRGRGNPHRPGRRCALNDSPCIKCGQCSAHCPWAPSTSTITAPGLDALCRPGEALVVQIAPAVRVAIGEAFGREPGEIMTGKIYAALRRSGFNAVFDTNFSADLTIMEEGRSSFQRFTKGELPLITSCCPAWTDYMEKYYQRHDPNFSTAKSPSMMQGALTKTYYAERAGIDPAKIFMVAGHALYREEVRDHAQREHVRLGSSGYRRGPDNPGTGPAAQERRHRLCQPPWMKSRQPRGLHRRGNHLRSHRRRDGGGAAHRLQAGHQ
jgi:ferredoxin